MLQVDPGSRAGREAWRLVRLGLQASRPGRQGAICVHQMLALSVKMHVLGPPTLGALQSGVLFGCLPRHYRIARVNPSLSFARSFFRQMSAHAPGTRGMQPCVVGPCPSSRQQLSLPCGRSPSNSCWRPGGALSVQLGHDAALQALHIAWALWQSFAPRCIRVTAPAARTTAGRNPPSGKSRSVCFAKGQGGRRG